MLEQITQYNLYNGDNKFLGIANVTLPTFDPITNTVSGAGILGEYEASSPGAFGSAEMEIPFKAMDKNAADLLSAAGTMLFLRAAVQDRDASTQKIKQKQLKITVGGTPKGYTVGSAENSKSMDSSVKMEVLYYKQEFDGVVLFELDKLNNKFVINGTDQLLEIKSMI